MSFLVPSHSTSISEHARTCCLRWHRQCASCASGSMPTFKLSYISTSLSIEKSRNSLELLCFSILCKNFRTVPDEDNLTLSFFTSVQKNFMEKVCWYMDTCFAKVLYSFALLSLAGPHLVQFLIKGGWDTLGIWPVLVDDHAGSEKR